MSALSYELVVCNDSRAAALNHAFRTSDADVVILLEAGAVPGPRWLEHLLAALESSPRVGLAGPSTNRCWNEQGVFGDAIAENVEETAREAETRFGTLTRSLAPLYSLGDFCYAVKRETWEAIGGADESYGLGPCWEMDFNVRAARAGFDGLWVCGAYVWRAPVTPQRAREESAHFEASRRRYQDKFCGARLRGDKRDYRAHCRGDACPNFAPPPGAQLNADLPLVSCIMPTHDRRAFLPEAIRGFLAQDYPNLELLVVDDGKDAVADLIPDDARIRYFRLDTRLTVGAKRNFACEQARGSLIAHFDDDDWYPPSRVRVQVAALLERGADICGSSVLYFYDRARELAYLYRYSGGTATWIAGTTMLYRRAFWERNRFVDVQVGEDTQFLWRMRHAKIADLKDPTLFIAAVHPGNVSPKETRGMFWSAERVERVRDLIAAGSPPSRPLVSCVMPTYRRRAFVPLALACFRRQTYPTRELIVIDDGDDGLAELLRDQPAVRYIHVGRRTSIGAKRNVGVAEARGEIVALWDDDDWYGDRRLERQTAPILDGNADMTGLVNRFVLELPQRKYWTVSGSLHRSMFAGDVTGGTVVFRRSIWANGIRFPEVNLGEDAAFLRQALRRGQRLLRVDDRGDLFVYVRHGNNTWRFDAGTFLSPSGWSESAPPPGFRAEWLDAYADAARMHAAANA
jgi:O-antigen biosynthesis protein